jgi:hypothetical protein
MSRPNFHIPTSPMTMSQDQLQRNIAAGNSPKLQALLDGPRGQHLADAKKVRQVLEYQSFPHLTFEELHEAGRLGDLGFDSSPLENVIEELFPTKTIEALKSNETLRASVIAFLTNQNQNKPK